MLAGKLLAVAANHLSRLVAQAVCQLGDIASGRTRGLHRQLARRVRERIAPARRQLHHRLLLPQLAYLVRRKRCRVYAQLVHEAVELPPGAAVSHAERGEQLAVEAQEIVCLQGAGHRRYTVGNAMSALAVQIDAHAGLVPRHGKMVPAVLRRGAPPYRVLVIVVSLVGAQAIRPPPEHELAGTDARTRLRIRIREKRPPNLLPVLGASAVPPLATEPEAHRASFLDQVACRNVFERASRRLRQAHSLPALAFVVVKSPCENRFRRTLRELRIRRSVEWRVEQEFRFDDLLAPRCRRQFGRKRVGGAK